MEKQLLIIFVLGLLPLAAGAQSCDAMYPMGEWQTYVSDDDNSSLDYFVSLSIERKAEPNGVCGSISITDENDNEVVSGSLTYAGKELKNNMGTGTYYFNMVTKQGKKSVISINGNRTPVVIVTGDLSGHKAFKRDITLCPGLSMGTGGEEYGLYCNNEKEFLDGLRYAVKERRKVDGFSNLQQYINAHAKLNPLKPKYAKPNMAVDVRKTRNKNAVFLGKLKAGQTLPVVDEYEGWCQVRISESEFGWVPLSAVTLTNVQGVAAVIK